MPYVFDMTKIEWPKEYDEAFEPPAPKVNEFEYLPAPDFRGDKAIKVVRFERDGQLVSEPGKAEGAVHAAIAVVKNVLGGKGKEEPNVFGAFLPSFREIGIARINFTYDGGNDEGFVYLSHAVTTKGQRIERDTLVKRVATSPKLPQDIRSVCSFREDMPIEEFVEMSLEDTLGYEVWGGWLLGQGFGVGEYSMYGAFIVDLEAGTVTDDPQAKPFDGNIDIDFE